MFPITDHLLVSKEAQAIIGGVVGFWGGVFGMGSVYLLIVCLRRIRKQVNNQRNNGPMLIDKVSIVLLNLNFYLQISVL